MTAASAGFVEGVVSASVKQPATMRRFWGVGQAQRAPPQQPTRSADQEKTRRDGLHQVLVGLFALGFTMQGYPLLQQNRYNVDGERRIGKKGGRMTPLFGTPKVEPGRQFRERAASEFSD